MYYKLKRILLLGKILYKCKIPINLESIENILKDKIKGNR